MSSPDWRTAWLFLGLGAASLLRAAPVTQNEPVISPGQAALQELRTFATTGRVLHVGAHPDDENTQLIAYLSRNRGYDTAYLSITRGDGGQNLLGPEFDEKLGVARTQELLAARRIDGGRQFFTRAIDFGFSKNPDETLSIWGHQQVLGDVVRVIRRFRPDVIITRFPIPPGSGGHGHHTASAILALEAFKLAADPNAYPEQLQQGLSPWQAKRILWNAWSAPRGNALESNPAIKVDIGGNDPVTGESFSSLAARSRRMHKTQAMGEVQRRDVALETFVLLGGTPPERDFMDGVDPSWSRVAGAAAIGALAADAVRTFDVAHPELSIPALVELHRRLSGLPASLIVTEKRDQLERIIVRCLGLQTTARTDYALLAAGETVPITVTTRLAASVDIRWLEMACGQVHRTFDQAMTPGNSVAESFQYSVAPNAPVHQPYWLRRPASAGMYQVDDPTLIGLPTAGPDVAVTCTFGLGGERITTSVGLVSSGSNGDDGLPAVTVPPVAINFEPGAAIMRPGSTSVLPVTVKIARGRATGTLELLPPAGWNVSGAQRLSLGDESGVQRLTFEITAPDREGIATFGAKAVVNGIECTTSEISFSYAHIGPQLLQPAAQKRVTSVAIATRGHSVGFIPGAGDDVPDALRQLGYHVTVLSETTIPEDRISGFDTIVLGVRALNTRGDLATLMPALFSYASRGGTVVCQYNWQRDLKTDQIGPYRLTLSSQRVTDETAAVTFLAPDHPVLNTPNQITSADFAGWIQERSIYVPGEWDDHYVPILGMGDPGEPALKSSLLVAPYGKGYFVYTGLVFFRELPAGVPGAYRLFANLISLGK